MNKIEDPFHDDEDICLKCGGRNALGNLQFMESLLCECDTECTVCGYKDFWAYGFYMNGHDPDDPQEEFYDESS